MTRRRSPGSPIRRRPRPVAPPAPLAVPPICTSTRLSMLCSWTLQNRAICSAAAGALLISAADVSGRYEIVGGCVQAVTGAAGGLGGTGGREPGATGARTPAALDGDSEHGFQPRAAPRLQPPPAAEDWQAATRPVLPTPGGYHL